MANYLLLDHGKLNSRAITNCFAGWQTKLSLTWMTIYLLLSWNFVCLLLFLTFFATLYCLPTTWQKKLTILFSVQEMAIGMPSRSASRWGGSSSERNRLLNQSPRVEGSFAPDSPQGDVGCILQSFRNSPLFGKSPLIFISPKKFKTPFFSKRRITPSSALAWCTHPSLLILKGFKTSSLKPPIFDWLLATHRCVSSKP